jgi:DHA1 family bicyclomycin/chloramphenicol resistance-like MFS transporter
MREANVTNFQRARPTERPDIARPPAGGSGGVGLLVVLGALAAFGPITTDIYLPSLPRAAAALHTGPAGIGSSLTACLLGLAFGQLIAGPLSDRWGRRPVLLVGMAVFTAASALAATAQGIADLDLYRVLQGLAGAAGIAASLAAIRDRYQGAKAAHAYSILMMVTSAAPVVAPVVGSQLIRVTDWRGVFGVLACVGVLLFGCAYFGVAETLPPDRRGGGGLTAIAAALPRLAADRRFAGYALAGGFSFAAMFAYISASSFVFQRVYHTSAQTFAVLFALNACGLVLANSVNARLVRRYPSRVLLDVGLAGAAIGATGVLAAVLAGHSCWLLVPPLFVMVSSVGLTQPNAIALALEDHPGAAGSASAIMGSVKYLLGAAMAPLVGVAGITAVPMGVVCLTAAVLAAVIRAIALRPIGADQMSG